MNVQSNTPSLFSPSAPPSRSESDVSAARPQTGALESIARLVEERSRIAPADLAVSDGRSRLTYSELNHRAQQLANYLTSKGLTRGSLVAVCLPRSVDLVVAQLAVMKSNAAYLPLDMATPRERLDIVLQDADAAIVITVAEIESAMRSGSRQCVVLDREAALIASAPSQAVRDEAETDATDLVYVIYTSGSTGTPKGVEVEQRNLTNLVGWHNRAFSVTAKDRASQVASVGFDAAVWEIWPYLVTGASVHFAPDSIRSQPDKLRDWFVSEKITIGFVPTPLAERMVKLKWPAATPLRTLLTGADTLHQYPPTGLPFELVNNYGPTECTVVSTSAFSPALGEVADLPPIGRPIDNARVYILDGEGKQLEDGKIGEIYIAGNLVARGYRNLPQLTAERFLADSFAGIKGARMYRTGDLGCRMADGQIAFHGRSDDQIKIRGYRIDPSEVVHRIDEHPQVSASAVVARQDGGAEKRLVAYVVPSEGSKLKDSELREFLRQYLPEYMLPGIFVKIAELPVGSQGKLDRTALPAPSDDNVIRDEQFVAPGTETEKRVAALLEPLLHIDRIGANDNFFLLGGNSLLGTQVLTRVSEEFGVEMTLLGLFDHPSVAGIAGEVDRLVREGGPGAAA
jgi:amino acid adenylation domain-containing protein